MPVYKREYRSKKTRKAVWYFVLLHRKKRYKKSGFDTRKEAEQAERQKLNELSSKRAVPLPRVALTVGELMPAFIEHRRNTRAETTAANEAKRVRIILRTFGSRLIADISPGDIQDYVTSRQQAGLSNRAVNLDLTCIKSFFKFAVQQRAASFNPAREVNGLSETQHEKWIPTQEELVAFVEAAQATSSGKYIVPWLWLRAYSGVRPRESFFLEWHDIDFDKDQIYIRPKTGNTLKNHKFRVIDIHPELRPILLRWREEWLQLKATWEERHHKPLDHDWVFVHPRKHTKRAQGYGKAFCEAREATHLPKMQSYTLRHYFISYCVMNDIPFFTIAKWVGHKNARMIEEVYGHLNSDYRASQMKKLRILPKSSAA